MPEGCRASNLHLEINSKSSAFVVGWPRYSCLFPDVVAVLCRGRGCGVGADIVARGRGTSQVFVASGVDPGNSVEAFSEAAR